MTWSSVSAIGLLIKEGTISPCLALRLQKRVGIIGVLTFLHRLWLLNLDLKERKTVRSVPAIWIYLTSPEPTLRPPYLRLPKGPDLQEIIASSLSHIPHACLGWRDRVSAEAEAEVNEVMLPHCHCYSTWILGLGYLERLPVLEKGLSF